mmetsp:Transcript_36335/g.46257  ORF Transcript_36335/g.46257 Transcript_36335/m.46257 type:complete len:254 (-) Transcript_36335:195-956(-)
MLPTNYNYFRAVGFGKLQIRIIQKRMKTHSSEVFKQSATEIFRQKRQQQQGARLHEEGEYPLPSGPDLDAPEVSKENREFGPRSFEHVRALSADHTFRQKRSAGRYHGEPIDTSSAAREAILAAKQERVTVAAGEITLEKEPEGGAANSASSEEESQHQRQSESSAKGHSRGMIGLALGVGVLGLYLNLQEEASPNKSPSKAERLKADTKQSLEVAGIKEQYKCQGSGRNEESYEANQKQRQPLWLQRPRKEN